MVDMNVRTMVLAAVVAGTAVGGAISLEGQTGQSGQGGTNSKTANLKVTAEVVSDCRLDAHDLDFGRYDPVGANKSAPLDNRSFLEVTCTALTNLKIEIDACAHATGQQRSLQGPLNMPLKYELMKSAAGARWGTGAEALTFKTPTGDMHRVTVFGRIPAGQDVPAGQYADTCVVTVSY
jgi:spore coat protein U-like protein